VCDAPQLAPTEWVRSPSPCAVRPTFRLSCGLTVCLILMACQNPRERQLPDVARDVPEDRFVTVNGARLHYLDWGGDGPLMLLVHGFTTTAYDFLGIAPTFTDRYRVMALTRRGHGASDPAPLPFNVDLNVDDLAAFIAAFSPEPAVLVGMSHGGLEIPRLARRYPTLVGALIFLDGVFDWRELANGPEPPGFDMDSVYASFDQLDRVHADQFAEFWSELFRRRLHSQVVTRSDGQIAWQLSPTGQTFARYIQLWGEWDPTDYEAIEVPVLALRAYQEGFWVANLRRRGFASNQIEAARRVALDYDDVYKGRGIALLLAAVPDAEVIELRGTSHLLHWHRPAMVIEAMTGFLGRRLAR